MKILSSDSNLLNVIGRIASDHNDSLIRMAEGSNNNTCLVLERDHIFFLVTFQWYSSWAVSP